MRTIAICHYKIGGTDGVSLEIAKRSSALKRMGYNIITIGGDLNNETDFYIPHLNLNHPEVIQIKVDAFSKVKTLSEDEIIEKIETVAKKIKVEIIKVYKKEPFEKVFLHNIFSHGRNISAAKAWYEFCIENSVDILSINHDFYQSYGDLYKTKYKNVLKYLAKYVPPRDGNIKHVVINSIMKERMELDYGIKPFVFPDTLDFTKEKWSIDLYNKGLYKSLGISSKDLIILHATRIVSRKAVEIAIQVVDEISKKLKDIRDTTLYNGKLIDKDTKVFFLLPGELDPSFESYYLKLKKLLTDKKINYIFASNYVKSSRSELNGKKFYTLWDFYAISDIITYTSIWEGWGNQLIEAVFSCKPLVILEYPVYSKDIKNEGYYFYSLGDKFFYNTKTGLYYVNKKKVTELAKKLILEIQSKDLKRKLRKNFTIGNHYHGDKVLKKLLLTLLKND